MPSGHVWGRKSFNLDTKSTRDLRADRFPSLFQASDSKGSIDDQRRKSAAHIFYIFRHRYPHCPCRRTHGSTVCFPGNLWAQEHQRGFHTVVPPPADTLPTLPLTVTAHLILVPSSDDIYTTYARTGLRPQKATRGWGARRWRSGKKCTFTAAPAAGAEVLPATGCASAARAPRGAAPSWPTGA